MATTPSMYVPLDVNYLRDPKIRKAGSDAEVLFVRSLAYAKGGETDGIVHEFDLPVISVGLTRVAQRVKKLTESGLWTPIDGGWLISGWANWNESTAQLRKRKKAQSDGAAKTNHRKHQENGHDTVAACKVCLGEVEP